MGDGYNSVISKPIDKEAHTHEHYDDPSVFFLTERVRCQLFNHLLFLRFLLRVLEVDAHVFEGTIKLIK
jgi:hypothetical protein